MLSLVGILIVIIGFALKKDSILIIISSAIVTALVAKIGVVELLEIFGKSFVSNRAMAIFIIIMLVTGTLERNGLKEGAATLIKKLDNATPGKIIAAYGFMRIAFAAFNVSFGGVAGFVCPIIYPMATASVKSSGQELTPEYNEEIKGMSAAMENIAWFFGQVLFVGGSGALLVQSTLLSLGHKVELVELAKVQIPVAIAAVVFASFYFILKDRKLSNKK